jgi:hypothetical protein
MLMERVWPAVAVAILLPPEATGTARGIELIVRLRSTSRLSEVALVHHTNQPS